MNITGTTRVLGIFGDPVEQTLSPVIHNAAFDALGLEFVYVPFHVSSDELGAALGAVRALGMPGISVTIPHKEKVLTFLDEVDEDARAIGAVNTVVNRNGTLIGYNTDGEGYYASLAEETGFNAEGRTVVVMGSGGASRGILSSILKREPGRVVIANRTVSRAALVVAELTRRFEGIDILAVGLTETALEGHLADADLLINTTSLGMGSMPAGELPVSIDKLPAGAVVSDIVYKPLTTELIRTAEKRGLTVHGGLGMLVHQGALGFKLWTGRKPPVSVMREAALRELEA